MLISGCQEEEHQNNRNQELSLSDGEERRKEEMKNMIKGYITGIQEAKSQGKSSSSYFLASKDYETK